MSKSFQAEGAPSVHPRTFTTAGEHESTSDQLLEIQRNRPSVYFAAIEAINHDTQREMLKAINDGRGMAEYEKMASEMYADVSERTIRKHAKRLESDGLVERSNSYAPCCSFPGIEVNALVTHALYCYKNME